MKNGKIPLIFFLFGELMSQIRHTQKGASHAARRCLIPDHPRGVLCNYANEQLSAMPYSEVTKLIGDLERGMSMKEVMEYVDMSYSRFVKIRESFRYVIRGRRYFFMHEDIEAFRGNKKDRIPKKGNGSRERAAVFNTEEDL